MFALPLPVSSLRWIDIPSEMGVLELLTIISDTSRIGIAFRLPRGAVGSELGPGDGAENSLMG